MGETRYITKENKFSVKAKCCGFWHKHPVECATPETRTYVCVKEEEKEREIIVIILDLYALTFLVTHKRHVIFIQLNQNISLRVFLLALI